MCSEDLAKKFPSLIMIITLDSIHLSMDGKFNNFIIKFVVVLLPFSRFLIVYFNLCQFLNIKYDVVVNKMKLKKFMEPRGKKTKEKLDWRMSLKLLERHFGMPFLMAICCLRYRTNDCKSKRKKEIIGCRMITFVIYFCADLIESI